VRQVEVLSASNKDIIESNRVYAAGYRYFQVVALQTCIPLLLRVAPSSVLHVTLLGGTGVLQIGSVQLQRRIVVRCSVVRRAL
jgi:hypothetical protein